MCILCIYSVTSTATTKKAIQKDTLKNTKGKSKWNSKKYSSNKPEGRN